MSLRPFAESKSGSARYQRNHAGGDVQQQAMLQVLLNALVFDMPPQQAVEAPRFATAKQVHGNRVIVHGTGWEGWRRRWGRRGSRRSACITAAR